MEEPQHSADWKNQKGETELETGNRNSIAHVFTDAMWLEAWLAGNGWLSHPSSSWKLRCSLGSSNKSGIHRKPANDCEETQAMHELPGMAPQWLCSLELLEKQTSNLQEDACIVDVTTTAVSEILICLQHTQAQACEGLKSRQPNLYKHIINLCVCVYVCFFTFQIEIFGLFLGWIFFNKYNKHLKEIY